MSDPHRKVHIRPWHEPPDLGELAFRRENNWYKKPPPEYHAPNQPMAIAEEIIFVSPTIIDNNDGTFSPAVYVPTKYRVWRRVEIKTPEPVRDWQEAAATARIVAKELNEATINFLKKIGNLK